MSKLRRYEDAGGVVPLEWKRGEPADPYGTVIAEVWSVGWHWADYTPRVNAKHVVLVWGKDAVGDGWMTLSAKRLDDGLRIRRHARLNARMINLSLTLEDWK